MAQRNLMLVIVLGIFFGCKSTEDLSQVKSEVTTNSEAVTEGMRLTSCRRNGRTV